MLFRSGGLCFGRGFEPLGGLPSRFGSLDEGGLCGGNREPAGLCAIGGFSSRKPSGGGLW